MAVVVALTKLVAMACGSSGSECGGDAGGGALVGMQVEEHWWWWRTNGSGVLLLEVVAVAITCFCYFQKIHKM